MRLPVLLIVLTVAACARPDAGAVPDLLPAHPEAGASRAFWDAWGDGRAELSSYRATVRRYDTLRPAELVLIYVTEPHDRRTWVKDDRVEGEHRVPVLKLNHSLKFQTGIYPYSVMTSVFAPADAWGGERFQPARLTLSVQEWCGHVFHDVLPTRTGLRSTLLSYFEGESTDQRAVDAPAGTLYEDALLIQLRELDGPFNGGRPWQGSLVPALWSRRTAHAPLAPVTATISRADTVRADSSGAVPVTRFRLAYGGFTRTYDVEKAAPRRVLGWATSTGETAALAGTARLPYWQLNGAGDEARRADFGLTTPMVDR
jgi:hypothetical protein